MYALFKSKFLECFYALVFLALKIHYILMLLQSNSQRKYDRDNIMYIIITERVVS